MEQTKEKRNFVADTATKSALGLMAFCYNNFKRFKKYLKNDDGWTNFSVGICTEDNSVSQSIHFNDGKVKVKKGTENVDTKLILMDTKTLKLMTKLPPNEVVNLLLQSKMISEGNMTYLQYFNFLVSVLLEDKQLKQIKAQKAEMEKVVLPTDDIKAEEVKPRKKEYLKADSIDKNVKFIKEDQYLSKYSLQDFPRLKEFLDIHFNEMPEMCIERPVLMTRWHKEFGFETKKDGTKWDPVLRQGYVFKDLMEKRKPIIRKNDLVAGTSTSKNIGVILYPDGVGTTIWAELLTSEARALNPYKRLSDEDINTLNSEVFPYWAHRNFREWVRDNYNSPLCQKVDERFAINYMWKTTAFSHTIIDHPKLLRLGAKGIIEEIKTELNNDKNASEEKKNTLYAMILCYEGIISYAKHLSKQAKIDAENETDSKRKAELLHISEICDKVPENPCETLDEAVNALWIHFIAVHMESTNAGFSIGRLDQFLQPYFVKDMEKIETKEQQDKYLEHVIEICGCFFMRFTDHLPLIPDIGNYLFGGSSSNQAFTLGGVDKNGEDAVNDMTYILLKVTEMLALRDPNINARFNNKKNSKAYLKRLCEVNVNTCGTPSIHNDETVMNSLSEFNYPIEDLRDWSATGCVEPTLSGKHIGHTNCMMFNTVAGLEMALYNGHHPLMRWDFGPKTGDVENFKTFDEFFEAFKTQIYYMLDISVEYNNLLGEAHSVVRPTPMMSAVVEGCITKGKDVTVGGAKYNSSGIACIGLADITDSLMAIKQVVYDEKKCTLKEFAKATANNFEGYEELRAYVLKNVPLFGSGKAEATAMANRVTKFIHDYLMTKTNFRGGKYTTGFWSMSNHVAFGTLTGALPSGRLKGKPFTPGLTPEAHASKSLLDNLKDVASLVPQNMNNNIAFNVKVMPSAKDSHEQTVDNLYSYAKAYCDLGGMQMQFNVISSKTMRAAMANPDEYRDLMVRISGYNAYFVTLNKQMQLELINRAEYGI